MGGSSNRSFHVQAVSVVIFVGLVLYGLLLITNTTKSTLYGANPVDLGDIRYVNEDDVVFEEDSQDLYEVYPQKNTVDVLYQPLSGCKTPLYLNGSKQLCWNHQYPSFTRKACQGRIFVLGFHKCGSSDLSKWFYEHPHVAQSYNDYFADRKTFQLMSECPVELIANNQDYQSKYEYAVRKDLDIFVDTPANLILTKVIRYFADENFVYIRSGAQYLSYLHHESNKYFITMRDPADRVISHYFYHFHEGELQLNGQAQSYESIGNEYFHQSVVDALSTIQTCFRTYGVRACVLAHERFWIDQPNITASTIQIAHYIRMSCYVVFIDEFFKFIPKNQVYFSKLEDYSKHQYMSAQQFFTFADLDPNAAPSSAAQRKINLISKKKPVKDETYILLRNFFKPFNTRLANILSNKTWLFE